MNTAMEKEALAQILDQAVQDVTECTAGVRLHQGEQSPGEDLCTVQITFDRGFHTSLTLCADKGLLYRMACNSFHEDSVSPEDLEEFTKEYFDGLCGRIPVSVFQATHAPAHFAPFFQTAPQSLPVPHCEPVLQNMYILPAPDSLLQTLF